nr:putative anti-sigma-F factor NrsF [uncultured bacterium]
MKTEDLVSLLASGVEPIDAHRTPRRYWLAVIGGLAGALALTGGLLRFNSTLSQEVYEPMFWVRETYCAALGSLGLLGVTRLARPGIRLGIVPVGIAAVVIILWIGGGVALLRAPAQERLHLLLGSTAAVCPFLITLLATPLFVAFMWVLRGLAPTRLRFAGAAGGFAAGSFGALAYSLHCPELAAPFIGVWYLLGISIPTALGALLGPRLLRW